MGRYKNTKKRKTPSCYTYACNCDTIEECDKGIQELEELKSYYRLHKWDIPLSFYQKEERLRKKKIKLYSRAGYYWLLYIRDEYLDTYSCWGIFKHYDSAEYYKEKFKSKRAYGFIEKTKLNLPELLPCQNENRNCYLISMDGGKTYNTDWSASSLHNALKLAKYLVKEKNYEKGMETESIIQDGTDEKTYYETVI